MKEFIEELIMYDIILFFNYSELVVKELFIVFLWLILVYMYWELKKEEILKLCF